MNDNQRKRYAFRIGNAMETIYCGSSLKAHSHYTYTARNSPRANISRSINLFINYQLFSVINEIEEK